MSIVRILLEFIIITVALVLYVEPRYNIVCSEENYTTFHFPLTLQVICNRIFQSDSIVDPGLLFNPPERIADRLDELLETCGHPRHFIRYFNDTLVRSPPNVLNSLRSLLRESIEDT